MLAEYDWPTIPALAGQPPIDNAAATLILKAAVTLTPVLSVTRAMKENDPDVVGSPAICPEGASDNPAGSEPPSIVQAYGGWPPVADKFCEYDTPCVPSARPPPPMLRAAATVIAQFCAV